MIYFNRAYGSLEGRGFFMTKYIFVTGGVVSGLGKGIAASSIALLLKARGFKVFMQKFDPYINVDPGKMSPYQHGEVYVTADGSETDLDLGHYERFIDEELNFSSNITTGKVYQKVFENEKKGIYNGGTVQIVPHVTDEIKRKIFEAAESSKADFVITEIGGTIGDLESSAFIEALRQMRDELGKKETLFVHVTLVPYLYGSGELKSKPTQHSVIQLRGLGIQPDIIVPRSPFEIGKSMRKKIALYCSIPEENIIEAIDVPNIYQIPINFYQNKMEEVILKQFALPKKKIALKYWYDLINKVETLDGEINVALVGKYVELHDAYLSVVEALKHAAYQINKAVKIQWVSSEDVKDNKTAKKIFKNSEAIIVPAAFGKRGSQGMLNAIKYARENKVPFLGIGMGMQLAVIDFAKEVCGLKDANSAEFDPKLKDAIVYKRIQKDFKEKEDMRLGNYDVKIIKNTIAYQLYGKSLVSERHRNAYEINNSYKEILEEKGLIFSGIAKKEAFCEILELKDHPFFVASLFHPEFKSRPHRAHPLFLGLIKCIDKNNKKKD